jgi:hypothetical protein
MWASTDLAFHLRPPRLLKINAFDFVHRDLVACAVIELGRTRRFVRSDLLRILERAAIFQIGCDTGRPKSMAAGRVGKAGVLRQPRAPEHLDLFSEKEQEP